MTAQEQFDSAVKEGQEVLTQSVRAWQDAMSNVTNTVVRNVAQFGNGLQHLDGSQLSPQAGAQLIDNLFDFAEQMLATQRQLAKSVLESGVPAVQATSKSATAATEALQQAASDSARVVQTAASKTAETASNAGNGTKK